jgi:hypothetical protein
LPTALVTYLNDCHTAEDNDLVHLQLAFNKTKHKSSEATPFEAILPRLVSLGCNMEFYAQHCPLFCEFTHQMTERKNSYIAKRNGFWVDFISMRPLRVTLYKNTVDSRSAFVKDSCKQMPIQKFYCISWWWRRRTSLLLSRAKESFGDDSKVAKISSGFSSVSTCLLRVLLLFKIKYVTWKPLTYWYIFFLCRNGASRKFCRNWRNYLYQLYLK